MIVSIGLADRNSVSYRLAEKLALLNAPVSYLAPFSQKQEDLQMLEEIIDKCILFDPVFCNTDGKTEDITFERLSKAFCVNTDIRKVCVEKSLYEKASVKEAVDRAMKTVEAKLIVYEENSLEETVKECVNEKNS